MLKRSIICKKAACQSKLISIECIVERSIFLLSLKNKGLVYFIKSKLFDRKIRLFLLKISDAAISYTLFVFPLIKINSKDRRRTCFAQVGTALTYFIKHNKLNVDFVSTGTFLYFYPVCSYHGVSEKIVERFERTFKPIITQWSNTETKRTRNRKFRGISGNGK